MSRVAYTPIVGLYIDQANFRMIGNKVEGGGRGNASSITGRSTLHRYRSSIPIVKEAGLVDRSISGYNIVNNCYINMVITGEGITMIPIEEDRDPKGVESPKKPMFNQ